MRITITIDVTADDETPGMLREPNPDELRAIFADLAAKHEAAYWQTEDGSLVYFVQEPVVAVTSA